MGTIHPDFLELLQAVMPSDLSCGTCGRPIDLAELAEHVGDPDRECCAESVADALKDTGDDMERAGFAFGFAVAWKQAESDRQK